MCHFIVCQHGATTAHSTHGLTQLLYADRAVKSNPPCKSTPNALPLAPDEEPFFARPCLQFKEVLSTTREAPMPFLNFRACRFKPGTAMVLSIEQLERICNHMYCELLGEQYAFVRLCATLCLSCWPPAFRSEGPIRIQAAAKDVKAENVVLHGERAVLIDFGIAPRVEQVLGMFPFGKGSLWQPGSLNTFGLLLAQGFSFNRTFGYVAARS